MALLSLLEVIWIDDDFIKPPGPKMVVCVAPETGLFFRINSKNWPVAVPLLKADNGFLHHDSFLECNGPLELDDYIVQQFLDSSGAPIGRVAASTIPAIWLAVNGSRRISPADQIIIGKALGILP